MFCNNSDLDICVGAVCMVLVSCKRQFSISGALVILIIGNTIYS